MPNRSAQKGKRFESYLLDYIRKNIDGKSYITKGSGNGTEKGDIVIPTLGLVVEAKNQSRVTITRWFEKISSQVIGDAYPVVMFRNPDVSKKQVLVVIDLEDFTGLLDGNIQPRELSFTLDYRERQALNRLTDAIKQVQRIIPEK